jgi:hypothetical protein
MFAAAPFAGENSMDKADIKKLKESGVFGPLTFWVTEIKNLEEAGNPNAAVRWHRQQCNIFMAASRPCVW